VYKVVGPIPVAWNTICVAAAEGGGRAVTGNS
jgi:hypothetical protein